MNPYFRLLLQSIITGGATAAISSQILLHNLADYSSMGKVFLAGAVIGLLNHLSHNPFAVAEAQKQNVVSLGSLKDK